jgi:NADPH-dependent 2,4-dienoyl-CoA reductase/sulfur reductase-like enzyme
VNDKAKSLNESIARGGVPVGTRIVVIGSGLCGCELAEFLTKRGRKVTILEAGEMLGEGMVGVLFGHPMVGLKRKV